MAIVVFKWMAIPISDLLKHFMIALYTLWMFLLSMIVKTKAVMKIRTCNVDFNSGWDSYNKHDLFLFYK